MTPDGLVWIAPLFGLIIGSFLGALTYRLPRGKSVAQGRSQCPHCKTPLKAIDLVPVLSWLATGGKCRYCGAPISARYPLIELTTAVLFLGAAFVGSSALHVGLLGMAGAFVVVAVVLWLEHRMASWAIWAPALGLGGVALLALIFP